MADTAGRRDPKSFEPPPWEAAQFEELARAKEAEAQRAAATIEAAAETQADSQVQPDEPVRQEGTTTQVTTTEATAAEKPAGQAAPTAVSEAALMEMMAGLAAEEPPATKGFWQLGAIAAVVLAAIGSMMLVFGIAGLAKTADAGLVGKLGGTILVGFGIGMIAIAIWVIVRTLKQRGVL